MNLQHTRAALVRQRAEAAYIGLAVGDALGATVEFMTPNEIRHQYGVHQCIRGGGWLNLKRGMVTDDTTMSLALGEAIIQKGGVEARSIAESFDRWMAAKPVDIGNTVRRGILHFRRKDETQSPYSEHDAGNGACMRTLPIALTTLGQDDEDVLKAVRTQAHITHNNTLSDMGTYAVTRMVQWAMLGRNKKALLHGPMRELIAAEPQFQFRSRTVENPSGFIVDTLKVVFQAFIDSDSFSECMLNVVNRGGDADTTGAIAGMLAGAYYGVAAIPADWQVGVDQEVVGQCVEQARDLLTLSPWSRQHSAATSTEE